ncbi:MAG: NlpC/P60 family protein [Actinomycetota bacterium]|nr:NlpC/P60 family protein [Actinomycetota bacterium]
MHHGRTTRRPTRRHRIATIVSGLALATAIGLVPSTSAQAEPDIDDVQARVDSLYHEAEQASERYNDAKLELDELNQDLDSLSADQKRQDQALESVRNRLADSVVDQYEGSDISAAGQVFLSGDSTSFLSQMATMAAYSDFQDQLFDDYATEIEALDIRHDATKRRADQVAALEERLAAEKKTIDEKHAEAEALLERLKEEERDAILSRGDGLRVPSDVPASGRAAAAVEYAMAQVGDSYVYGAAGPSSFDCSGLTMMAWAQAGVSLPHSSSAQYGSGSPVSADALRAGDLVFYYSPISHVGMYIGNGMIVHAANPGTGVVVSDMYSMPYVGAVRPG